MLNLQADKLQTTTVSTLLFWHFLLSVVLPIPIHITATYEANMKSMSSLPPWEHSQFCSLGSWPRMAGASLGFELVDSQQDHMCDQYNPIWSDLNIKPFMPCGWVHYVIIIITIYPHYTNCDFCHYNLKVDFFYC